MRAAIVLAAGRSRRFGRADKLFTALGGVPLLLHAIRAARAAPASRVLVATTRPARVRAIVCRDRLRGVQVVRVAGAGRPLSASLQSALKALRPIERDVFVFLGDMPDVDFRMAARLVRRLAGGFTAARPRCRDTPGHPVLVRDVRAVQLRGDDGGFRFAPGAVGFVPGGRRAIADVDRRGDLARARRRRSAAGRL